LDKGNNFKEKERRHNKETAHSVTPINVRLNLYFNSPKEEVNMKRLVLFLSLLVLIVGTAQAGFATVIMYTDETSWENALSSSQQSGIVQTQDYPGDPNVNTLGAGTSFNVGNGENVSFDNKLSVYAINNGWDPTPFSTWPGGYTGEVLTYLSGPPYSVTGTFGNGGASLGAFGFYAQPEAIDQAYNITVVLSDGTTSNVSISPADEAQFYGWRTDSAISYFTITSSSSPDSGGFAFGNLYSAPVGGTSPPAPTVPEPSTILLLTMGVMGLGLRLRKRN
jgi:hypothetical protein